MSVPPSGFIAFDYDGTLVDSLSANLRITNEVCVGLSGCRPITRSDIENLDRMSFEEIAEVVGIPSSEVSLCLEEINRRIIASYSELDFFPGIVDALRGLRGDGWDLYVVTHNTEVAVSGLLETNGLSGCFSGILGAETGLPKDAKLASLVEVCGAVSSECAMFGDSVGDIDATKSAGIVSVGVSWGYQSRSRLEEASPDFIIDAPEDVLSIVRGLR
jgi:phosphoglycolate phosphatase-like HAD superfamily hydrolase